MTAIRGVILDVDGTLVDSNGAHVRAWQEALLEFGFKVELDEIRPLIGMGGDQLLPALMKFEQDDPLIEQIGDRRSEMFRSTYLPTLTPTHGAAALLQNMKSRGLKLVVASSATSAELEGLLEVAGVTDLIGTTTSADDAESSKPEPDIVEAALGELGYAASEVVMLGDTPYDIEAAGKVGVRVLAVRCGGFSDADLRDALAIYDDPADLLHHYEQSVLALSAAARG